MIKNKIKNLIFKQLDKKYFVNIIFLPKLSSKMHCLYVKSFSCKDRFIRNGVIVIAKNINKNMYKLKFLQISLIKFFLNLKIINNKKDKASIKK